VPAGRGRRHHSPRAETFPGNHTQLDDHIRSFEEICDGKHDKLPEQALDSAARRKGRAFMYVGPVEQAVEKAKKLQE